LILRPKGSVVLQYSDKTKPAAAANPAFSANDPVRMRAAVTARGYEIIREDTETLHHSSVIQFSLGQVYG
jgi:hypothetical protein